jgi:membrane protein required for colicin V production
MSLFDLAAGLVLLISALVGWFRGGAREVATVAALVAAAVTALFALRYTGPIARHAIHTPWLANIAAILIVFVAVYVLLRIIAAAISRRVQRTSGLSGVDHMAGAGFGVARALVILGLVNLTITAVTPPERMPDWISGAALYPVSAVSARALKAFAPQGAKLARQVAPVVGHAIASDDADAGAAGQSNQNRAKTGGEEDTPGLRVERSP